MKEFIILEDYIKTKSSNLLCYYLKHLSYLKNTSKLSQLISILCYYLKNLSYLRNTSKLNQAASILFYHLQCLSSGRSLYSLRSVKPLQTYWNSWVKLSALWVLCVGHIVSRNTCLWPCNSQPTLQNSLEQCFILVTEVIQRIRCQIANNNIISSYLHY